MLNSETCKVLKQISEFQISAFERIKKERDQLYWSLVKDMFGCTFDSEELDHVIDDHIDMYKQIIEMPQAIKLLNEYQVGVCCHILYRMEDEWIIDNSIGVYGAWNILQELQGKFHPEYKLIIS